MYNRVKHGKRLLCGGQVVRTVEDLTSYTVITVFILTVYNYWQLAFLYSLQQLIFLAIEYRSTVSRILFYNNNYNLVFLYSVYFEVISIVNLNHNNL